MVTCDLSEKLCLHCLLWTAEPDARPLSVVLLLPACSLSACSRGLPCCCCYEGPGLPLLAA